MKKIFPLIIAFAAILSMSSCGKSDDFSGSDGDVSDAIGPYMMCIADNLIVDNLKILEYSINNKTDINSKTSVMEPSNPSYRVPGVKIEKAAEDSTWIISNKDLDYWFLDTSYPTDYTITARMLPGDTYAFHGWNVTITGERREKDGYSCGFSTENGPLRYTVSDTGYSWSSCQGSLNLIVYKDGKVIDTILMLLKGKRNDYSLVRTYSIMDIL